MTTPALRLSQTVRFGMLPQNSHTRTWQRRHVRSSILSVGSKYALWPDGRTPTKQVNPGHFADNRVDESPAKCRPRPINLAGYADLELNFFRQVVGNGVASVALAEPRIAHRHLVGADASWLVFVMQQPQIYADLCHLGMDVALSGPLKTLLHVTLRIEQRVDLVIAKFPHLLPGNAALASDVEQLVDAVHGHVPGLGY